MTDRLWKAAAESVEKPTRVKDRAWWIESMLENWQRWMESGGKPDAIPNKACAGDGFSSYDEHSEAAYDRMDLNLAITTNAVIDDLEPIEQAAICHAYLAAVFSFHRHDMAAVLKIAKLKVGAGLERKGVWLGD